MSATTAGPGRRERARAATIEEIKATALDLIRESGSTDVRFTDIAKVMGMTAPALYRYFADKDELLTALIADAYDSLGAHLEAAGETVPGGELGERFLRAAQAYREWARREPQQFSLILGLPMPGYAAPAEGPTTEAASRAMGRLQALFVAAQERGVLREPLLTDVDPAVAGLAAHKQGSPSASALSPASFQAMMHAWAALHGFTSLEAFGHLDWLGEPGRDALFRSQVTLLTQVTGMPAPRPTGATTLRGPVAADPA